VHGRCERTGGIRFGAALGHGLVGELEHGLGPDLRAPERRHAADAVVMELSERASWAKTLR
jgi:hypothetical protein